MYILMNPDQKNIFVALVRTYSPVPVGTASWLFSLPFTSLSKHQKVVKHEEYPGQRGTPMSLWNPVSNWKIGEKIQILHVSDIQTCLNLCSPGRSVAALSGKVNPVFITCCTSKAPTNLHNGYQPETQKAVKSMASIFLLNCAHFGL